MHLNLVHFSTETRVEQLVPKADDNPLGTFRSCWMACVRNRHKNWTQVLEVRDIVLLENRVPRTFERFDAVQKSRRCVVARMGIGTRVGQSNLQHGALNRMFIQPYPFGI